VSDEHVIIDGYNVVFRTPGLRQLAATDLEGARGELLRVLELAFRSRRQRVTVVFDSREHVAARATHRGRIRVVFTRPPQTADARIGELVDREARRAAGRRPACRVVTSDTEVAERARLWRAKAVSVESFLAELGVAFEEKTTREIPKRPRSGSKQAEGDPGAAERPAVGGKRELDQWEALFEKRRDSE
jgi:predicted RNA-binding protein with PIN domain